MIVETKVKKIISKIMTDVDSEKIIPQASLIDDLGADSLSIIEMVQAMEESFDLEIDDDEAEKLLTVQSAIDLIKARS